MRSNALAKLRLTYEDVAEQYPRLIYVRLAGFGAAGPRGDEAAYDDVIQAACGLSALQSNESGPQYVRSPIADKVAGLMGVSAVLAAVVDRQATGRGQSVEVPMFETMVQFVLLEQHGGLLFDPPIGPPGYARTASPHRRPYRTADGYISVVVYTDRQWISFFRLIERPDLTDDPRFATVTGRTAYVDELYEVVAQTMPARTTAEWLADLRAVGIAAGLVHDLSSLQSDEHLLAADFFEQVDHPTEGALRIPRLPVQFSAHRPATHFAAPSLGAHGVEILESLGFQADEIRDIIDGSV
jgi:crotonobetainyl-CoA:carnitine CoA-transferase CaiB-like acyl-CoA transferase